MNNKEIKLVFSFTDDSGETTTLEKTFNDSDDVSKIFWLLDEFKGFLNAYGFPEFMTNRIVYLEKDERVVDSEGNIVDKNTLD